MLLGRGTSFQVDRDARQMRVVFAVLVACGVGSAVRNSSPRELGSPLAGVELRGDPVLVAAHPGDLTGSS